MGWNGIFWNFDFFRSPFNAELFLYIYFLTKKKVRFWPHFLKKSKSTWLPHKITL
jgi:hypothetical protein